MFILINRRTFILKNGGKWSISYKTEASIHLSQWREWIYGSQLGKERKLLRETIFIPIDRWALILKNGGKWSFSYETLASIHLSQWGEWIYGA